MNNSEIDNEIIALTERKTKLLRLSLLRRQCDRLENGTSANRTNRTIEAALLASCDAMDVMPGMVKLKNRPRPVATARHLAFHIIYQLDPTITTIQIGKSVNKTHGTVIHGRAAIANRIETEPKFALLADEALKQAKILLENPKT